MAKDWEIGCRTGVCASSGRAFEEGEEFYTVIFEDGASFRRIDFSLDAWEGTPDGAFCSFKTRVPVRAKKRKLLVDDELLIDFFLRLEQEQDQELVRVQFRFVLALILMRKRLLRYEDSQVEPDGEVWRMTLMRDRSPHRVVNPRLNNDEIDRVSGQLSSILHSDTQEWALEPGSESLATSESGQADGETS